MRVFDASFELLEFVAYAIYVNLQNDEISLVITARFVNACGVCSPNCPFAIIIFYIEMSQNVESGCNCIISD